MHRGAGYGVVALAAILLACGCGGADSPSAEGVTPAVRLDLNDLRPLVTVSPVTTGWPWQAKPQTHLRSAAQLNRIPLPQAIQRTLRDAENRAGAVHAATSSWWDEGQKASAFATVYETPRGAREALAAQRTFAHAWFPQVESVAVEEVDVGLLGEDRWAVRGGFPPVGEFVEIAWTQANAVLGVYVNCTPCSRDVEAAARAWARAIDKTARAVAA